MMIFASMGVARRNRPSVVGVTLSNDTSLSLFLVNNEATTDEGTVNAGNGTTEIPVECVATHAGATFGGFDANIHGLNNSSNSATWLQDSLVEGDNTIGFDVTAEDGVTVQHYNVTLHVLTAGVAEITEVTTVADVAGSLNGKYFLMADSAGSVEVYIRTDGKRHISTIDTAGAAAADLEGDSFVFYWDSSNSGNTQSFIFTLLAGSSAGVVGIDALDTDADIATKLKARMETDLVNIAVAQSGTLLTVTHSGYGAAAAATFDSGTGFAFAITQQGQGPASAPGVASRSIMVNVGNDASAISIANAMQQVVDADSQYSASVTNEAITITDAAIGARTDAADVNTGFTVTVTQQGEAPA